MAKRAVRNAKPKPCPCLLLRDDGRCGAVREPEGHAVHRGAGLLRDLLRRRDLLAALGVTRWLLDQLLTSGQLKPIPPIYPGARSYYRRRDVEALLARVQGRKG